VPGRVLGALADKSVVAVAAGREHAVVASSDGKVYSFGGVRAALGREGRGDQPGLVTGALGGQHVTRVAAGEVRALWWLRLCCCCHPACWATVYRLSVLLTPTDALHTPALLAAVLLPGCY
jgi:hypothetical protein